MTGVIPLTRAEIDLRSTWVAIMALVIVITCDVSEILIYIMTIFIPTIVAGFREHEEFPVIASLNAIAFIILLAGAVTSHMALIALAAALYTFAYVWSFWSGLIDYWDDLVLGR